MFGQVLHGFAALCAKTIFLAAGSLLSGCRRSFVRRCHPSIRLRTCGTDNAGAATLLFKSLTADGESAKNEIMKRLDQGHLHPLLEHPCLGRESNKEQSAIPTAYLIAIRNLYMAAPVHVDVCRPNSTCKFHTLNFRHLQVRVFESRWGHHYEETLPRSSPSSTRAPRDKQVSAGNRTRAACVTGEQSTLTKSYSNSLLNCYYSEPLQNLLSRLHW
jgi:hypothetical protein